MTGKQKYIEKIRGIMKKERIISYLKFAQEIEKLKKLERFRGQYFWRDYPFPSRYESVADHTWRLAVMLLIFSQDFQKKIDLQKALTMALIHDIPEILTGDASPLGEDGTGKNSHAYNPQEAEKKHKKEKKAAQSIFGMLPKKV